jgi:hypothetical protein
MKLLDTFRNMDPRKILMTGQLLVLVHAAVIAQVPDSVFMLTGIICTESFQPVPATHVVNLNTHKGSVSDSLGIFRLPVHPGDTLLVRNIVYVDTLVPVASILAERHIRMRKATYPLQEVKIFEWGSTYNDFREAIIEMPNRQSLGESLGLPRQDPDHIPFDMDEEQLKSAGFLLHAPIYYFYYNFSRKERSRRKVYWINRDREKHEIFEAVTSPENISQITGLSGEALQGFLLFLFQKMACDFKCDEISIYSEIYDLWRVYQELEQCLSK